MSLKSNLAAAVIGLAAVSLTAQANAGLMGDTVYVNGSPYVIGSGPMTLEDGWLPYGTDDNVTINSGNSWISLSLYAPDLYFFWNHTSGNNFTLDFTSVDWDMPGSYIDSISWIATGDAEDAGINASLISGTEIGIYVPGDFHCDTADCGDILINVHAYEPAPPPSQTYVPEPGTLALFGLGLAGLGFSRRRTRA